MCTSGEHRRLFFFDYDEMIRVLDLIVSHQGFSDRMELYKTKQTIGDGHVCERRVVHHVKTVRDLEVRSLSLQNPQKYHIKKVE